MSTSSSSSPTSLLAEFLAIQPNRRVLVIINHTRGNKVVWESVVVLLYLMHHYDMENKFWFTNPNKIADGHQWLLFQASGVGPYFGQKVTHHHDPSAVLDCDMADTDRCNDDDDGDDAGMVLPLSPQEAAVGH
jgi:glutathione S-transferase